MSCPPDHGDPACDGRPARPPAQVLGYGTGLRTREVRPPGPPVFRAAGAALLLFPAVLLLAYPIAARLPFGWHASTAALVPTSRPSKYGGTAPFNVRGAGAGRWGRTRISAAYVWLGGAGGPEQLTVRFPDMRYRRGAYDDAPISATPLTRDVLLGHLATGGFDPQARETAGIADGIMGHLSDLRDGRLPPDATGDEGRPFPTRWHVMAGHHFIYLGEYGDLVWLPWYTPWCLLAWLGATWLAGRALIKRHRRRVAAFEAALDAGRG